MHLYENMYIRKQIKCTMEDPVSQTDRAKGSSDSEEEEAQRE